MRTSELFQKEINYIDNEHLKNIVVETLDSAPECIVHIPASSSGKYHPVYSLGEGGLMRHIKAAVGMAHSLIATDIFKNFIFDSDIDSEPSLQDIVAYADVTYAALILHDCCKPDNTSKHRTQFDHPLKASELFVKTAKEYLKNNNVSSKDMQYFKIVIPAIKSAIASHMGQFNTAPYAKGIVLPTPRTPIEKFVHLLDFLASRKFLIFDFDVYEEVDR